MIVTAVEAALCVLPLAVAFAVIVAPGDSERPEMVHVPFTPVVVVPRRVAPLYS